MTGFIARRLAWTVVLLLLVSTLTFVIFYVLPTTDPAVLRAGRQPTPALIREIRANLGLDKPVYVQYARFMRRLVLHGDLGYSFQNDISVRAQIVSRLPATISLAVGAVILWLAAGITIGTLCAWRPHTLLDRGLMAGALVFISTPVYWLGLVALYLFSSQIGTLVPIFHGADTYEPLTVNPSAWLGSLLLPWIVLAATYAAIYARFVRSQLLDVVGEPYIRTARAKGAPERRVFVHHGLRAALMPVITLTALDLGALLGGVILVETVFNIPGIGRLGFEAVQRGDQPMMQGMALFGAFFIVVGNLVADVVYAFFDPRIRYGR